mmetsp:Transcript_17627/g.31609  ORF Transcript_17627/g.31609 Transcript_17627/m.31609 type:complete len:182 (-) Transcript_17627:461-1006(-)
MRKKEHDRRYISSRVVFSDGTLFLHTDSIFIEGVGIASMNEYARKKRSTNKTQTPNIKRVFSNTSINDPLFLPPPPSYLLPTGFSRIRLVHDEPLGTETVLVHLKSDYPRYEQAHDDECADRRTFHPHRQLFSRHFVFQLFHRSSWIRAVVVIVVVGPSINIIFLPIQHDRRSLTGPVIHQ